MAMDNARDDRPAREPEDPRRAAMARRTLTRWAVRLALREWKQRILIVLLIAVASAATLLGIAVASATPGTPNAGTFGTAATLVELPGNTPQLPGVVAKIEKAYGAASVVYDEPIATGQAGGADLRAQDPSAPYPGAARARLRSLPVRARAGGGHVRARPALRPARRRDLARPRGVRRRGRIQNDQPERGRAFANCPSPRLPCRSGFPRGTPTRAEIRAFRRPRGYRVIS
jgi:hypothetical protein